MSLKGNCLKKKASGIDSLKTGKERRRRD